jgi:chromosomal replication initiator protein
LNRIIAFADLSGSPLTPSLVEVALSDLLPSRGDLEPSLIFDLVARKFNTTVEKLLGRDRSRDVALPRQIAMYILREEANFSFPQIGAVLGGRDHSTVMYAIEKISDQIERDDRLRRDIVSIKQQLYGQAAVV